MPNTGPDSQSGHPVVHVAAAAIFDEAGRVLIARRPAHVHQGGLWEFPGGKVETDEVVLDALRRELHEELGIDVQVARPLIRVHHDYPDKSVLLDVWRVDGFAGKAPSCGGNGCEGQPVKWVLPNELDNYDFPAANIPIVTAVRLPDRYLITPNPGEDLSAFLVQLENCLRGGIRLVQLRAKSLPAETYAALARQCVALCKQYDASLMLNADPKVVAEVGAQGVHLDSVRLESLSEAPFQNKRLNGKWVSASCHSAQQLEQARKLGADFVMVSPVATTASHPDTEPLGWEQFQLLTEQADCPVYALGGMTADDLEQAFAHGAQGVAAIRALWESFS
jgi:8-oxo-dGTP diphosphatase